MTIAVQAQMNRNLVRCTQEKMDAAENMVRVPDGGRILNAAGSRALVQALWQTCCLTAAAMASLPEHDGIMPKPEHGTLAAAKRWPGGIFHRVSSRMLNCELRARGGFR